MDGQDCLRQRLVLCVFCVWPEAGHWASQIESEWGDCLFLEMRNALLVLYTGVVCVGDALCAFLLRTREAYRLIMYWDAETRG